MSLLTRRDALLGASTLGMAGLGVHLLHAQTDKLKDDPKLATGEIATKLKLTEEQYKKSGVAANLEMAPVALEAPKEAKIKEASLEPVAIEIKDGNSIRIAFGLQWTCPTDRINLFTVGGSPFVVRRFTFSVLNIAWQAGDGWPVYTQYCPRNDYHTNMWYRHAKVHQIVPSIRGQNYFVGCLSSAICESANSGQVAFAVNDGGGDYGDNRGTITVVITNWS